MIQNDTCNSFQVIGHRSEIQLFQYESIEHTRARKTQECRQTEAESYVTPKMSTKMWA